MVGAVLLTLAHVALTPARADAVNPLSTSCTYESTEDCIGFTMITETCTTTYSNGTTSTTVRRYPSMSDCFWCYIFDDPCLDDGGWV